MPEREESRAPLASVPDDAVAAERLRLVERVVGLRDPRVHVFHAARRDRDADAQRHADLGRSYDALRFASALAALVARNPVEEESRAAVTDLLRGALAAFASGARPDIVYFKSVYRFARGEGYPLKQQWFPTLPSADRTTVATLLNRPLAEQTAEAAAVARLQRRLDEYLRGHTEILVE